jgi:thioredoxin 1
MSTIAMTAEVFEASVVKEGIIFADFWAAWCGPCRSFAPIFEQASLTHPDITFAKIDTEAEHALAAAAQITSIPTLMAFRDGVLVYREAGALPASALEQLVTSIRELNMDDVRNQISEGTVSE